MSYGTFFSLSFNSHLLFLFKQQPKKKKKCFFRYFYRNRFNVMHKVYEKLLFVRVNCLSLSHRAELYICDFIGLKKERRQSSEYSEFCLHLLKTLSFFIGFIFNLISSNKSLYIAYWIKILTGHRRRRHHRVYVKPRVLLHFYFDFWFILSKFVFSWVFSLRLFISLQEKAF